MNREYANWIAGGTTKVEEYQVILHTPNGDVTTSYPENMLKEARDHVNAYVADGKHFSFKKV